jgi:uridylate kinase
MQNDSNLIDVTALTTTERSHIQTVVTQLRNREAVLPVDCSALKNVVEALPSETTGMITDLFPELVAA